MQNSPQHQRGSGTPQQEEEEEEEVVATAWVQPRSQQEPGLPESAPGKDLSTCPANKGRPGVTVQFTLLALGPVSQNL